MQKTTQKTALLALGAAALLGIAGRNESPKGFAAPAQNATAQQAVGKMVTTESQFYCNLKALNPEQRKRLVELSKAVRTLEQDCQEISDGIEMRFPADSATFQTIAEWVTLERLCCPFFDFDLHLQSDGGAFLFRLTGKEGVKQFIRSEFQIANILPAAEK